MLKGQNYKNDPPKIKNNKQSSSTMIFSNSFLEKKDKKNNSNILFNSNFEAKNKNKDNKIFSFYENEEKNNSANNNNNNSKNIINNNVVIYNMPIPNSSINIINSKKSKNKKLNLFKKNKFYRNKIMKNNLNDLELNTLEYQLALKLDKRTYIQYYFSLLKKKHLILFTFLPIIDYNLLSIKITLFLLSISLFFTINGFFFSDNTMHNVFESNGSYDLINQIPFIIYSFLITYVINAILRSLSLSERTILNLKKISKLRSCLKIAKEIENCLKIKFIIFFIISFLFMSFFWYYISCFCSVYKNTQIILIKDTSISFGLSLIYPFGINLVPGCFRIAALRKHKKDKKFLYNFSKLLSLI